LPGRDELPDPDHDVGMRPPSVPRDLLGDGASPIFVARRAAGDSVAGRAPVSHQYAALAYYTAGRARVEQRGLWTVERGDVLLVPAGEAHRMVETSGPELWGLGFCVPCFVADDGGALADPFERVRAGAAAVVRIPDERHGFLESLFHELADASSPERRAGAASVQRSLLTLILNEVGRAAHWGDAPPGGGDVVAESLRVIERRCLGPLTLQDVAEAVGRTPSYVTTALTRATGRSAVAWIVAGRMAEARRRLLHSDERIDIIAERVGYADVTHFIRMFRREHGATPAAWRSAQARPA
jgi:AraC family transcriptional activator of pobA